MHLIFLILLIRVGLGGFETIKLCNREFLIETERQFYKDHKLWVTVAFVKSPKDKKKHFGYIVEGKRNDTVFMYSKISIVGDTVIRTNYNLYNISSSD
jgi:hypothetical protein